MFQQSILSGEESRRSWAFSISLLAQALFIAIAILIPLLAKPILPELNAAIVSLQLPKPPRGSACAAASTSRRGTPATIQRSPAPAEANAG